MRRRAGGAMRCVRGGSAIGRALLRRVWRRRRRPRRRAGAARPRARGRAAPDVPRLAARAGGAGRGGAVAIGVSRPRMRVGISSWADPALIESRGFYPRASMSAEARLRFYASVFDVVEVNSSYYAIPDVRNVQRWVARTPPGFVFHVKAWALMTGHHPRAQSLPAHEALATLRRAGAACVIVDGPAAAGAVPRVAEVTAPMAVFRLHGRNAEGWLRQVRGEEPAVREKYDYLYTETELRELMPEIEE